MAVGMQRFSGPDRKPGFRIIVRCVRTEIVSEFAADKKLLDKGINLLALHGLLLEFEQNALGRNHPEVEMSGKMGADVLVGVIAEQIMRKSGGEKIFEHGLTG